MDSSAEKRHGGDRSVSVALRPPSFAEGVEARAERPRESARPVFGSGVAIADLYRSRLVGCRRVPWRGGDVEAHLGGFELPCAGRGVLGIGAGPMSGITGRNVRVEGAVVTRYG